jgi:hypothetical protein
LKAASSFLRIEDARRRLDTWRSSGTAETLITARPRLPVQQLEAAVGAERLRPAHDASSPLARGSRASAGRAVCCGACRSRAGAFGHRGHVVVHQAGSSSSRITKPGPPAAWNWFTSALPFG